MKKIFIYNTLLFLTILVVVKFLFINALDDSINDNAVWYLDLSDGTKFTASCTTPAAGKWEVENNTCTLSTSGIVIPGDETKDPNLDVPISFTVKGSAHATAANYCVFEYKTTGAWTVLENIDGTSLSVNKTKYTYLASNLPAGSTIYFRVIFNTVSTAKATSPKFSLHTTSATDVSVGTPYITGTTTKFTSSLPVSLLSFTSELVGKDVNLNWSTATEINNDYFIVEESRNGMDFTEVAKVKGAGNSNSKKDYSVKLSNVKEGMVYYRLRQTDYDGRFEVFDITALNIEGNSIGDCRINVSPNPCIGKCRIILEDCDQNTIDNLSLSMFDFLGNSVRSNFPISANGNASLDFDVDNNLKPGVYIVRGSAFGKNIDKKVIINK